jgi:hypothetical protein
MGLGASKQHDEETDTEPRAWIKSFDCNDPGRPLNNPQSIKKTLKSIVSDPEFVAAFPIIPGKLAQDLDYSDDISVVKVQNGLIMAISVAHVSQAREQVMEKLK